MSNAYYRHDIDGLRAVAVLCVVAFHAFPSQLEGGFIGVDVFFVISGFLISDIVFKDLEKRSFSFMRFYARRIRRIFPALLVVLACSYLLGSVILLEPEKVLLGWQIVMGAGFFSNFALADSLGYFAPSIDTMPLMHLWSLSIEEQFYVVWPFLLVLSFRNWNAVFFVLLIFAVISFLANVVFVYKNTALAYYMPYCRFWEMALGGLLAHVNKRVIFENGSFISVAGFALIFLGLLFIDKNSYFPGWWALFPALGTVLLIHAGPDALINRHILSNRALSGIGLISYPLYLWHWILLSFARIVEEATPSVSVRVSAVMLGFFLAWLTYRLIEKPLRSRPLGNKMTIFLLVLMLGMLVLGYWTATRAQEESSSDGFMMDAVPPEDWSGWTACNASGNCWIIDPDRPADIAVIGDSHAGYLGSGLAELAKDDGVNIIVRRHNNCLPFFTMAFSGKEYFNCAGLMDQSLEDAITNTAVKTIIMVGYAAPFIFHYPDGVPENSNLREISNDRSTSPNPDHIAVFSKALDLTLERLVGSGKNIIFLVDNPEIDFNPRECVSLRPFVLPGHELRNPCAISLSAHKNRTADYHRILMETAKKHSSIKFLYSDKYLCDQEWCWAMISKTAVEFGDVEGTLLYGDRNHLTPAGGRYLLRRIKSQIVP